MGTSTERLASNGYVLKGLQGQPAEGDSDEGSKRCAFEN